MTEDEIDQLGPMINENGKWVYDKNYILVLEDGLPYYTVEERKKRIKGFKKTPSDSVSLMDGLIPDPGLSEKDLEKLVKDFIKRNKD